MSMDFKGKTAVITGGATGIGFAIAKALGAEGARIVIGEPRQDKLDAAVAALEALGITAAATVCDVRDLGQVEALADFAWDRFGQVDALFNNAGIAIARAMILRPKLLILDEPTSALDMTVQVQIVQLLRELQQKNGLAYLFISHNLKVVRALSHKVMVMKQGDVVEAGDADAIFDAPRSAYTRSLMGAAFEGAVV